MNKEFIEAIEQLEKEKGMSQDLLYEALEAALTKAYKKSVSPGDGRKKDSDINLDVEVRIDRSVQADRAERCPDDRPRLRDR